jgi:hypothetical protein
MPVDELMSASPVSQARGVTLVATGKSGQRMVPMNGDVLRDEIQLCA